MQGVVKELLNTSRGGDFNQTDLTCLRGVPIKYSIFTVLELEAIVAWDLSASPVLL